MYVYTHLGTCICAHISRRRQRIHGDDIKRVVGQAGDVPRSYYQGRKSDPSLLPERQGNSDLRTNPGEEDMDIGYEDKPMLQIFEGLEQKFLDEILKLAKEQNDAEDAENAGHRESINNIDSKYQEQRSSSTGHSKR